MSKLPKPFKPVTGGQTKKSLLRRLLFLSDGKVDAETASSKRKVRRALANMKPEGK